MAAIAKRSLNLDRQSFLGRHCEMVFERCHVAVIGLGGGGSHVIQQLAHLGVGNLTIFDPDVVEDTNLNRLVGAAEQDVLRATPKASVAARVVKGINPTARVHAVEGRWQVEGEGLRECDVIFGCVDSLVERAQVETLARRYLIPYIDIGMDIHAIDQHYVIGGQVMVSLPGYACLKCVGIIDDALLASEAANYGAAGHRPQVVWPNGVLASLAIGAFVQLVSPWHNRHVPALVEYDGNAQIVSPSNKLLYVAENCPHFSELDDLGDPFWIVR